MRWPLAPEELSRAPLGLLCPHAFIPHLPSPPRHVQEDDLIALAPLAAQGVRLEVWAVPLSGDPSEVLAALGPALTGARLHPPDEAAKLLPQLPALRNLRWTDYEYGPVVGGRSTG